MKKSIFPILFIALSMLFSVTVSAADNAAVVGKWSIERNFQGQSVTLVLTITETADGLAGTWASPRNTSDISGVSFDGETLTFSRQGRQGGTNTTSFKLEGETLVGMMGGPNGQVEVTAKKST